MIMHLNNIRINIIVVTYIILVFHISSVWAERLEIKHNDVNKAYLVYEGNPVFAYGPSPQWILTCLPKGNGNDFVDWCDWAQKFGITNVRSYPPVFIVGESRSPRT